jgi:hypothetical protein
VSAGTQSAKMLPVPHISKHSQIHGATVTFLQTMLQQKLDNYEYQELEPDQLNNSNILGAKTIIFGRSDLQVEKLCLTFSMSV